MGPISKIMKCSITRLGEGVSHDVVHSSVSFVLNSLILGLLRHGNDEIQFTESLISRFIKTYITVYGLHGGSPSMATCTRLYCESVWLKTGQS
jgi:hypothetical protein